MSAPNRQGKTMCYQYISYQLISVISCVHEACDLRQEKKHAHAFNDSSYSCRFWRGRSWSRRLRRSLRGTGERPELSHRSSHAPPRGMRGFSPSAYISRCSSKSFEFAPTFTVASQVLTSTSASWTKHVESDNYGINCSRKKKTS